MPYYPKKYRLLPSWWKLCTILHLLVSLMASLFVYINFPDVEMFPLFFSSFARFVHLIQLNSSHLSIFLKSSKILGLLNKFSETVAQLSEFGRRRFNLKNLFPNFLFYWFIFFILLGIFCLYLMWDSIFFGFGLIITIIYVNNVIVAFSINFCVFVSNMKWLFQYFNDNFRHLKGRRWTLSTDLKRLRNFHLELCEIVERVEDIFFDCIAIFVIGEGFGIIFSVYFLFKQYFDVDFLYWCCMDLVVLTVKLYICSSTTKQVNILLMI